MTISIEHDWWELNKAFTLDTSNLGINLANKFNYS